MHHLRRSLLVVVAAGFASSQIGMAFQSPTSDIKVCSLLPKAEVKKLIGGNQVFDLLEPEEEAVAGGSSCSYPGVMIQVIPFRQSTIDTARKRGGLEPVSGFSAWRAAQFPVEFRGPLVPGR